MTTTVAKTKQLLTMDRSGEFHIKTYGPNHCGISNNVAVKYMMNCECAAHLDSRGFLFEQLNVDSYFQSLRKTKMSCEKLTISCVKDLIKMIRAENHTCHILRMELTLSPAPFAAAMKYTWVSPK